MSLIHQPLLHHAACPALVLILLFQRVEGQNLVPNPSFEDVNMCSEFDQPCSPSAWFYLSRKFTTGYFPRNPQSPVLGNPPPMPPPGRGAIHRQPKDRCSSQQDRAQQDLPESPGHRNV